MSFHDIRFPPRLSLGSMGGPERFTEIVTLANGFEERNTPWAHSRRRYDAGVGMRSLDDVAEVIAFFEARKGRLHGFRWKDWGDHKSCLPSQDVKFNDQIIGVGDGLRTEFTLTKTYDSGGHSYVRPISKPILETLKIGIDGLERVGASSWTYDSGSMELSFNDPPPVDAILTAGFQFDVPVRFDTDSILTSVTTFQAGEVPDIPVMEIRV